MWSQELTGWSLLILCIHLPAECTISPGSKTKAIKKLNIKEGPRDESVFDLNLIQKDPLAKDIISHSGGYCKDTATRRFNGTVLGYVTPWNSHGYDVAKIFAPKFDIISPVWLQITKPQGEDYQLAGTHDIDAGWLRDLRRKGKRNNGVTVKIFPRLIFDKITSRDLSLLLSSEKERLKLNEIIVESCEKYGFNGIVLEIWSSLSGRVNDEYIYTLILDMAKLLERQGMQMILVIPPYRKETENIFTEKHLNHLYKHIYAFSLMTYDFSNVQRPGANSPLYWIRKSIEHIAPEDSTDVKEKRSKILMGLNMYGNDYTTDGGSAIVGGQYLDLLKHVKKRLSYDEHDVENYSEIRTSSGRHFIFYPTLYSINERLKLAREMGVGLSLWELGQGLDYFYDLF